MNVWMTNCNGFKEAIMSLYVSKGNLDNVLLSKILYEDYDIIEYLKKVAKYGQQHITLLKFIDFSFYVTGMHRAGQDDWDSHAKRFDNRIIRRSTRLSKFNEGEVSDYYLGKILTCEQIAKECGITLPEEVWIDNTNYVKTTNGYIDQKYANDQDVQRGLYMLSIPSDFIFKVNLAEFAHIYKLRNDNTNAHPEVKKLAERCADLIDTFSYHIFDREFLLSVDN